MIVDICIATKNSFSTLPKLINSIQSQLSEVNSAQLDFIRANQSLLRMINEKIKFSDFKKVDFIDSYSRLNNLFTNLSFDIYNSSKYYLIKNNVLTPGLDTELRRQFDVCHSCRRCFNLCDSFPKLFDLIDESESMELDTVNSKEFKLFN